MYRILTAAVLVPILWVVVKLAPAWVFTSTFGLAIGLGVLECYGMLDRAGRRPFKVLGIVATFALVWSFSGLTPGFDPLEPMVALVIFALVGSLWARDDPEKMLQTSMSTIFPVLTIGLMLSFMVGIRMFPSEDGEDLLLLLLVCVMFGDTAAFYTGSTFGRHRMAPGVSPNKSWEGAIGGLAGSVGGAVMAHFWFFQRLPWVHAILLGILLGALGILGDLIESMIKRATGAKDASRLLPGHGGLLDRLDSLLLASPVLFYYYRWILGGSM